MIIDIGAYIDGARVDTPDLDAVPALLAGSEALVWAGLRMASEDELRAVAAAFGLGDLDLASAMAPHDRPVLTSLTHGRWLVLRTARYSERLERVELGELSVLFGSHFVVTVRHGPASPLGELRQHLEAEIDTIARGVDAIVAEVIAQVIADYEPALNCLERDVLEAERDVFDARTQPPVRRLYLLKRQILSLLIVADAAQDPLERMVRRSSLSDAAELQLSIDRLDRVAQRARTLADLVSTAIAVNLTQVSLQQNEDMRRISAWVAIAAVPTLLAGLYGMNFDTMPELRWQFGYPLVLAVMATVCGVLYRSFRRSGWL